MIQKTKFLLINTLADGLNRTSAGSAISLGTSYLFGSNLRSRILKLVSLPFRITSLGHT